MAIPLGPIATAIAEVAKVVGKWQASADKRKMSAAIEAGEKYIQTNEDTSLAAGKQKKLLAHFKKRFFIYNN